MLPKVSEAHAISIFRVRVGRLMSFENDGGKGEIDLVLVPFLGK